MSEEKLQAMVIQILRGKRGVLWVCASKEMFTVCDITAIKVIHHICIAHPYCA